MAFGKVKKWDSVKKFGFITPQEGGKDLFFHISELPTGQLVQVGEIVTYEVGTDRQGRVAAVNINNSHASRARTAPRTHSTPKPRKKGAKRSIFANLGTYAAIIPLVILFIVIAKVEEKGSNDSSSSQKSSAVSATPVRYESGRTVTATGKVIRILSDDTEGSRHQRFILQVPGRTLLVAHNIDLAPRIPNLRLGDAVTFSGVYEPNDKGGVIHWTHHDPSGRRVGGWLRHDGLEYR